MLEVENLTQYLELFGPTLGAQIERRFSPLVDRDTCSTYRSSMHLRREPYQAQWTVIEAIAASWNAKKYAAIVSGEPGVGKTLVSMAGVHLHAAGRPYRALVLCPSHLVEKWIREIQGTIPGDGLTRCFAAEISSYKSMLRLRSSGDPSGPEFWVMSGSKSKLGSTSVPAFNAKKIFHAERTSDGIKKSIHEKLRCPSCGTPITKIEENERGVMVEVDATVEDLQKKRSKCKCCGEALFQWTRRYDRWPCADIVAKQMRHFFDYLIVDEAHETKGENTAAGNAVSKMAGAVKYKIAMTGTLMNGYASSLLPTLFRMNPSRMVHIGMRWGKSQEFALKYGRLETVTVNKVLSVKSNKVSKGQQVSKEVRERPGIMPGLYGECLMGDTTFLQLADLGVDLPKQTTKMHAVKMDSEMRAAYHEMESQLRDNLAGMLRSGSKAAMSMILNTLIGWPDYPRDFGKIGYMNEYGEWVDVCVPPDLSAAVVREKEQVAVDVVTDAVSRGNQVWLYNVMTGKRDVQPRLESLIRKAGIDVRVLRSAEVPTAKREAWIRENCKAQCMIMHPKLVATGLDAFDSIDNQFNYNVLFFYSTGYVLDTVRQAACRSRRIGQWKPTELHFSYYAETMQEQAAELMARKTRAAESLEGVFTETGLASLAGGDEDASMALVRTLERKVA